MNNTIVELLGKDAEYLLNRDVDYIVRKGRVEIIDEFTGRVVEDRHWPDGLQAAVEAKEGLSQKTQGRILGSITFQHFLGPLFILTLLLSRRRKRNHEVKTA